MNGIIIGIVFVLCSTLAVAAVQELKDANEMVNRCREIDKAAKEKVKKEKREENE